MRESASLLLQQDFRFGFGVRLAGVVAHSNLSASTSAVAVIAPLVLMPPLIARIEPSASRADPKLHRPRGNWVGRVRQRPVVTL